MFALNRFSLFTPSLAGKLAAALISLGAATTALASPGDALALVPADATSVGMIRLVDLRNSPLSGRLFMETDKLSVDGDAKRFLKDAGLDPKRDVDVVVAATSPQSGSLTEPAALVLAEGRFDVDRLSAALASRGAKSARAAGRTYFLLPEGDHQGDGKHRGAVAFVSSGLVIGGTEESVVAALERKENPGAAFRSASNIGRELGRIDPDATAWALVDVARAKRFMGSAARVPGSGPSTDAISAAMKTVSIVGVSTVDTGDTLEVSAFGISSDAETRDLLVDTLRGMTAAWRLAAQEKAPELVSALRKFDIGQTGDSVTIHGVLPASLLRSFGQRVEQQRTR